MTIQTVIINRGSLILASDLRATIDEYKSYVGVKKIFDIKPEFPAGIMINGLMDFEKVPLETLIGEFKKQIKDFKSIGEIRDRFLSFLSKNTGHTHFEEYIKDIIDSFKDRLCSSIDEIGFEKTICTKTTEDIPYFIKRYSNFSEEFHDLIPPNHDKEEYNLKIWEIFSHELNFEGTCIIMAGFDENNHYASLFTFNIFCNDNGKIIWREIESLENIEDPLIRVYAINEEAYAFITGISEDFENYIREYIKYSNSCIIQNMNWYLNDNNIPNREEILNTLKTEIDSCYNDLDTYIAYFKNNSMNYTSEACEFVPRQILCDLADYLIKLTALKQKLSLNLETVSKESDILLITKSNNVKWIKTTNEIV